MREEIIKHKKGTRTQRFGEVSSYLKDEKV